MNAKNVIAVTMGDPAGIGSEVILKAYPLLSKSLKKRLIVIGDASFMESEAQRLRLRVGISQITEMDILINDGTLNVIQGSDTHPGKIEKGKPTLEGAKASLSFVDRAIDLAMINRICAFVTAPINKNSIAEHRSGFSGHTEYIAQRTASPNPVMLMVSPKMKVIPLTTHLPISQVPERISTQLILNTLKIASEGLQVYFGISKPVIAVTGLNPHSGQDNFGNEERDVIIPAIMKAKEAGIDVSGPYPADSIFPKACEGSYDLVLAMYHDQALIPIKTLGFMSVVNVTLGIPLIRTSVGHGVAYDIAAKGIADPTSMINAIEVADSMSFHLSGSEQRGKFHDQVRN